MEDTVWRSRTRGVGVPFGDAQNPTCKGQLLEAMDCTQAEVCRPRMGEFPGDAAHPRVTYARTEGRPKGSG